MVNDYHLTGVDSSGVNRRGCLLTTTTTNATNTTTTNVMRSSFWQQLQATLVRNVRLKLRDSRKTIAEVFLPLYTLGTLIVLKILIPNPNFAAITEPPPGGGARLFDNFHPLQNHTIAVLPFANGTHATRVSAMMGPISNIITNYTHTHTHTESVLDFFQI